jgi:hypothetical protein
MVVGEGERLTVRAIFQSNIRQKHYHYQNIQLSI